MFKRLPYLALALLFGVASSLLFGGRVRAAYLNLYDGTVVWAIGRRDTTSNSDFNYTTLSEPLPRFGSVGQITGALCGVPSNRSSTTYTKVPSFISITSPDLVQNGGYIYLSFCFAYDTSIARNVTFGYSNIGQYLSSAGSLAYAVNNGTPLTRQQNFLGASSTNSAFSVDPLYPLGSYEYYIRGTSTYDGSNFPHVAYMTTADQDLERYGLENTTLYSFGDTASNWARTYLYSCRIVVPATPLDSNHKDTIWIDLSNSVSGTFKSVAGTYSILDDQIEIASQAQAFTTSCVYLCPVYCYAVSQDSYQSLEYYLQNIWQSVDSLAGQNPPSPGILESYAALGSQAREEAARAASQMAAAVPSYVAADYDVDTYVDSHALDQFKQTVGFLSHSKILPIVMLVFILATVAYVFFGKKGG